MGIGQMLGILSGLGEILNKVFTGLFKLVFNILVLPVVRAFIRVVVTLIKYACSTIFYEISCFILKLIDFVEVLFRALAGLDNKKGGTIFFGLSGSTAQEGDLLLQFITNKDVLNVFYATAIVGLFLLVITTIFQMIKVEYTTEGAQNSKSGIIGKSLKSLTNMLIIPLLVVFGVFIGNQILSLIDTATGGSNKSTISGNLWVTAASTATLKHPGGNSAEGSFLSEIAKVGLIKTDDDINGLGLFGAGLELALGKGFDAIFDKEEAMKPIAEVGTPDNISDFKKEEINFKTGENKYYKLSNVCKYYNLFEVNYLVLIFGACIILKCLFFVCFGMIDRLYRCTALFIVMPMVVGMSPVKDSLGKWRTDFISRALSAYGTVISMNLFFVLVGVMLNIEITFNDAWVKENPLFPQSFMEGLIKSMMLIVGCLMIEKLAGDMGSYFGGGNAMAEGKGLANDATAGIKKAAVVAGGVAMGAGGLALKGIKGAGSIANKISGGRLGNAVDSAKQGLGSLKNTINNSAVAKTIRDPFSAAGKLINKGTTNKAAKFADISKKSTDLASDEASAKEVLEREQNALNSLTAKKDPSKMNKKEHREYEEQTRKVGEAKKALENATESRESFNAEHASELNQIKKANKVQGFFDDQAKAQVERADLRSQKRTLTRNAVEQLGKNMFGAQAVFNAVAPKDIQGLQKKYQEAYKQGNDTEEGKAMMGAVEFAKGKKKNEEYNSKNGIQVAARQQVVSSRIASAMVEKVEFNQKTSNLQLDKLAEGYNNAKTEDDRNWYIEQMRALNNAIQRPVGGKFDIKNNPNYHVNFDMTAFKKNLDEAIKKNAKTSEIEQIIQDQLAKWGQEGNTKLLNDMYKVLTELRGQLAK